METEGRRRRGRRGERLTVYVAADAVSLQELAVDGAVVEIADEVVAGDFAGSGAVRLLEDRRLRVGGQGVAAQVEIGTKT